MIVSKLYVCLVKKRLWTKLWISYYIAIPNISIYGTLTIQYDIDMYHPYRTYIAHHFITSFWLRKRWLLVKRQPFLNYLIWANPILIYLENLLHSFFHAWTESGRVRQTHLREHLRGSLWQHISSIFLLISPNIISFSDI